MSKNSLHIMAYEHKEGQGCFGFDIYVAEVSLPGKLYNDAVNTFSISMTYTVWKPPSASP